jgi:CHAD domain-containing protein
LELINEGQVIKVVESTLQEQPLLTTDHQGDRPPTLGDYAHQVITEQFQALVKQKKHVLADEDPEHLHKMRVAARRLQSALQTFEQAIELPKAAQIKSVRTLAKTLGRLRDLDVQRNAIDNDYYPLMDDAGQSQLNTLLKKIQHDRQDAFEDVERILTGGHYKKLKNAFEEGLENRQYGAIAQMPLNFVIPELIHPLLANLLLHPGWLIPTHSSDMTHSPTLHELRKTCKAVRYQAEFFEPFYNASFQDWITELKTLQDNLGKIQDGYVLQMLHRQKIELPELQGAIDRHQRQAMEWWEPIRKRYLSPKYRQQLHYGVLAPIASLVPKPKAEDPASQN